MSYVRIVSKRKGGPPAQAGELVVPIDRSNPILGNPIVLADHLDAAARERVLREFDELRAKDEGVNGPITQELRRLGRLVDSGQPIAMQCWCAPRPCHGNPLRAQLERMLGRDLRPSDEREAQLQAEAQARAAGAQASLF
ncbi:hypothetical protein D3C71_19950 [compost metagenome]